jgi:hypothetical protein
LLLGKEIINDAYEIERLIASQVVVYLLADTDRFWKDEGPHAVPVLYFYRGYSLPINTTRNITEKLKETCRSHGLDIVASAADGEFAPMIVRGRDGNPLTQHQLSKDVWKEVGQMSKSAIIKELLSETKECNVIIKEAVRIVSSQTGSLANIRTPSKGWIQPKNKKKKEKENQDITTL